MADDLNNGEGQRCKYHCLNQDHASDSGKHSVRNVSKQTFGDLGTWLLGDL